MADALIRRLALADLPAALALQADGYPEALWDGEEAFVSRMTVAPEWCWALERHGRLDGYLLSHPWGSMAPPAPDTVLTVAADGPVWYIHDLSVAPHARGTGVGKALLETCRTAHPDVGRSELIAVEGAAAYWARLGWAAVEGPPPALAAKVAAYGPEAVYMAKRLD